MRSTVDPERGYSLHPLHSILLSFVFPLFLGTFIADLAYLWTAEIQWANFAQWLNASGLFFGFFALIAAQISVWRYDQRFKRLWAYALIFGAAWGLGLWNAFVHAQDAWAIMPEALWYSGIAALLAGIASWLGYHGHVLREGW